MLQTTSSLLAIPVVDIDGTLFVQAGLFLALTFVLDHLLFKPWLATRERRYVAIHGALEAADRLRFEADELDQRYGDEMTKARESALELRSEVRRKGEAIVASKVALARNTASGSLDEARTEIRRQAEVARQQLESHVEEIAGEISRKVLGRAA